jgi:uncharacterized membrane protein SpoIIM required for sporulation
MRESELRSAQFRREREARWRELEGLVQRVERGGVRALTAQELHSLPALYRAAISSLSVARSISLDRNVVEYLEGLAARAYFAVYSPRRRASAVIAQFFARSFPQAVRTLRTWILCSTALLAVGFFIGRGMTLSDLDNYHLFVDAELAAGRDPTATPSQLLDVIFNRDEENREDVLGVFATFLFTNNAQVGLLCYALGVVPFLLVGLLLVENGMMLGAFVALHEHHSIGVEFGSWILPHGVTELLAVMLCGGAGFAVGMAAIFPGRRTRLESLVESGRRAGTIAVGCIAMFFVAALIEGFFRQLVNDVGTRYFVAGASALWWTYYFGWVGRQRGAVA